jgi:hypothetical protein
LCFTSCSDDDLNSIDAGFINNLNFVTTELISEVEFTNEVIDSVKSTVGGQFLLGVYDEPEISKIRGSFVSHLVLPSDVNYYSDTIYSDIIVTKHFEDVVLYIPYHSHTIDINDEEEFVYKLDSVFGVKDVDTDDNEPYGSFDFKVHELETFLNPLNPTDPSSTNVYYSGKTYEAKTLLADVPGFSPTVDDFETIIERKIDGVVYTYDTIRRTNNAPRIAVHLDKDFFETYFFNKLRAKGEGVDDNFQSQESFIRYFKGLYVQTTSGSAASMVSLPLTNASVEMYYTNVVTRISTDEIDTIQRSMSFTLGGVKAVKYETFDTASQDDDKLYIQGTAGSQANIKLFGYNEFYPNSISVELDSLRNIANDSEGNLLWLINEASLWLYVNEGFSPTDAVHKLFLYKKTPDYNSQLLDYITASPLSGVEGNLLQDENEDYYYKFRLTDYITKLLKGTNTTNVDNLGLKVYNTGDYPVSDTLIPSSSWNPRGVVLYGHSNDSTDVKRIKLKINYSYQIR